MDSHETTPIPDTEIEKRFGHFQDEAIKGPVVISQDGLPRTVLLSYEDFLRLQGRGRRAYRLEDLPPHLVAAILDAEVPEDLVDEPGSLATPSSEP